uniref:Core-binding (CB) domain-containing protein n=1 Tax=Macrostomum lignano TaxID=282301 RepID=A0A1I8G1K6_9PLAT
MSLCARCPENSSMSKAPRVCSYSCSEERRGGIGLELRLAALIAYFDGNMINFSKIATGDISGLANSDLQFISRLSMHAESTVDQFTGLPVLDHEEVEEFLNSAIDPECSLRDLDAKELQNIKDTEASSKSPSTLATTRNHIERLKKFLREKKLPGDIERMPLRYVDSYLRLWYVRADSDVWYSAKQVLRKNTLNDMMKNISRRAGLQFASVVTYLAEAGHSAIALMLQLTAM